MSTNPRITLITTVRNGAAFIERCLKSVIAQRYDNLEYIVLDAASTDGTQDIVGRYLSSITYFRSMPDRGPNDAIMQGFRMATGDIIGILHADDWLSDGALQTLAQMHRASPQAEMFCFAMQEYKQGKDGELVKTKSFADPAGENFTLLDGLYCQGVNRYYSRPLLKELGIYRDEVYPNLADRDFYVRLGIRQTRKVWTDKVLYNFLTHAGSNSTGGSAGKVVRFLDETARMAQDYLKNPVIAREQDKEMLRDWYCFNMIRSIAFRLKAGKVNAIAEAVKLMIRYPLRTLKNLKQWKMPEPYRARPTP